MKYFNQYTTVIMFFILTVVFGGCSSLYVHIDLYKNTRTLDKDKLNQSLEILNNVHNTRNVLDTALKSSNSYFTKKKMIAKADPGATTKYLEKVENSEKIRLAETEKFAKRTFGLLDQLEKNLQNAIKLIKLAEAETDLSKRFKMEVDAKQYYLQAGLDIISIDKELDFEFGDIMLGDNEPRKLSLNSIGEELRKGLNELKFQDISKEMEKYALEFKNAKESLNNNNKNLLKSAAVLGKTYATNPDLVADDSDPFLRQIETGENSSSHWEEDFYKQGAYAGGNADYLIVRETATRYTLHRVKSDPTVLVRTQLRLARTGLKIASSAMSAYGVSLNLPKGDETPQATSGSDDILASTLAAAQKSRVEETKTKKLLASLQGKLVEFETFINNQQNKIDSADPKDKETTTSNSNKKAAEYYQTNVAPILRQYGNAIALAVGGSINGTTPTPELTASPTPTSDGVTTPEPVVTPTPVTDSAVTPEPTASPTPKI